MVWSAIFGILACWFMVLTLRTAGFRNSTALAGLALYGFSSAIWFYSSTANQYSTALFLHNLTLYLIVHAFTRLPRYPSSKEIIVIGVLISIATLSSQLNAGLLLAGIYLLLASDAKPRVKMKSLLLFFATIILISVALWGCIAYFLIGASTPAEFMDWQRTYITSHRYWGHSLADSLKRSIRGATELHLAYLFRGDSLFGSSQDGFASNEWFKGLPLKIGQALVLLFFIIETIRAFIGWVRSGTRYPIQNIGLVVFVPVMLFSFIFTPEQTNYRIMYLPGLLLFLSPLLERDFNLNRPSFRCAWPLSLVTIVLFSVNFIVKFLPESNPNNNHLLAEAKQLGEMFDHSDRIIFLSAYEDDFRIKYTRYFTECNVHRVIDIVYALRNNPEELEALFRKTVGYGGSVVVHVDALYSVEDLTWVNKRHRINIQPGEVATFFETHFKPVDYFEINGSAYIVMKPLPGYAGA
jgi:hypothetical protein